MPNGLAIAGGVTFPLLATGGTAAAPDYSFLGDTNTGMYRVAADSIGFSAGGALALTIGPSQITSALRIVANIFYAGYGLGASGGILVSDSAAGNSCLLSATANAPFGTTLAGLSLGSDKGVQWDASTAVTTGTPDLGLARLAAASLRQGLAPSATPVNQTFTLGESSRPGTDLNAAGANGIIRSGLGTGNAAGSSLIFQVPSPIGSSTLAQTYTQVMSLSALGATFDIPDQGLRINGQVSGAGAGAGTLGNAPAAGNPTFWLPINVAGTVRFAPLW